MIRLMSVAAPAAVIVAIAVLDGRVVRGQSTAPVEHGKSFSIHASGTALPAEMDRINLMLRDGSLDIESSQTDTMIEGRLHERLKQVYEGVPVFGGQIVRQIDGRSLISISGRLYEGIDLGVTPGISADRAAEIATSAAGAGAAVKGDVVLGVLPVEGGAYALAYRLEVREPFDINIYFVDAGSGSVVLTLSGIHTQSAAVGRGTGVLGDQKKVSSSPAAGTFRAQDELRPADAFTLDFRGSVARLNSFLINGTLFNSDIATDGDNDWNDGAVVDAHVYQGMVYDYYYKRFGRRGLDDHDLEIDGIVHPLARSEASRQSPEVVGTFINNAFFCCDGLMVYGDGDGRIFTYLAGGLDVVGHEMTHGVTNFSSNLVYRDEPGALNEAFSDIMAANIEYFLQPVGAGPLRADWLIGEDITLVAPGYLRSLNNPFAVGDPDHYSLRRFIGTNIDEGGVHFNMTIATHAYYLAVAGGRNRVSGITVGGIGFNNIERMERIFYRAFVFLMGPNSQFTNARAATLQAATDLYGSGSNERAQIQQAWTAVGVN
jgi:thermolysin